MKLALILCLISASLFAQKNGDLIKKYIRHGKDSTVDFQYYYKPDKDDTLDLDMISWDEIYRSAGWDCRCPDTTRVWQMPRELSPYQWKDKGKPLVITVDDSTFQELFKSDFLFKQNYRRADSLMRLKNDPHKTLQ